jgi:hypothetical protein
MTGLPQALGISASGASKAGIGPANAFSSTSTTTSPQPRIDYGKLYSGGFSAIGFGR